MLKKGFSDVLIGLQYGDEGKAKVIDLLAADYDIIARFNGGANAGHTIVKDGIRLALHQIPSGVFYPEKVLYIGSGVLAPQLTVIKKELNFPNDERRKDVERESLQCGRKVSDFEGSRGTRGCKNLQQTRDRSNDVLLLERAV